MGYTNHFNAREWNEKPIVSENGDSFYVNRLTSEARNAKHFEQVELLGIQNFGYKWWGINVPMSECDSITWTSGEIEVKN